MKKIIIAILCVATVSIGIFSACQKEDLKQFESNVDLQKEQYQKDYYEPDIDTIRHQGTICFVDYSTNPPTFYYMWGWEAITHSVYNYLVGVELTFMSEGGITYGPRIHLNSSTANPGIKGELTTEYLMTNYEIVYANISPEENEHFLQMAVEFLNQN